ncbi:hypothetical protein SSPSH_000877 [Salinisphaera shabanensis E1L3A]|uniref:Copper chaperone PCu(A)C n=1 Tax=Salinisphaera shabanensis E1L3A TaxID=1033802 RepID=U2G194_9GAMM|nr:copper chaperone PCu(A)C [Salinisphaera shabanensis]ERJ20013.1 hypothetical protein SSPSH_000877 [Salinisphaera shabanensis E1L3A]
MKRVLIGARARQGLVFTLAGVLSLPLVACGTSEAPDCGSLSAADPWVRVAPEGADVMGAYFTLSNDGDDKVIVNGVSSSQFDRAEMHETVVNEGGQASMHPIEQVVVGPGEQVAFESGGRHVMLFSPSQAYAAGDQVELILACGSDQAELPIAATVRADGPGSDMSHGGHDMDGMGHGNGADEDASEPDLSDDADSAGNANEDSASAE